MDALEGQPSSAACTDSRNAVAALWQRLRANPQDTEAADALVRTYQPLVKTELARLRTRLPRHVSLDELEAAGLEAVFHGLRTFDVAQGVDFEGYARKRVWGAMIDRVRRLEGVPRTALRAAKQLAAARSGFAQRSGRAPGPEELALELGISLEVLGRWECQAQVAGTLSLDIRPQPDGDNTSQTAWTAIEHASAIEDNPLTKMADAETRAKLVEGLAQLPERERAVLVLYYHENIMLSAIAAAMNVSKSRISQLHASGLERLKRFLTTAKPGATPETAAPAVKLE
jgi:RNA polymerase sigma factor FliA